MRENLSYVLLKVKIKNKLNIRNKVRVSRSAGGDVMISVFVFILGFIVILPFIYSVLQSLKPQDEMWIFPPRFFVLNPTLKNFRDLFSIMASSQVPFSRYLFNTIVISIGGTAGHVILSSMCAYALSKHKFPGKNLIFGMVVLSLMFSTQVTAVPNFLVMSFLNLMDNHLAIILPAFASSLGLYLMKQFMETNVPDTILESARVEGAGEFRIFWSLVMPMVKPAWLTLIIFSFQGLWNGLLGNMPVSILIQSERLKTLNYALGQITSGGVSRAGVSAATAIVLMLVPMLVFVVTQSNVVQTMSTSGMKD